MSFHLKPLILAISAFLVTNLYGVQIECLGGHQGNLLDRFTGKYKTSTGDFEYSAERMPAPSRTTLRGKFFEGGKEFTFNLEIAADAFAMDVFSENKVLTYAGGLCGRATVTPEGKIERIFFDLVSRSTTEKPDFLKAKGMRIYVTPDLKTMTEVCFWDFQIDYIQGFHYPEPIRSYQLVHP